MPHKIAILREDSLWCTSNVWGIDLHLLQNRFLIEVEYLCRSFLE